MKYDPDANAHREWIGYVQPTGLVVSTAALLAAQAQINQNIIPDHQRFLSCLTSDDTGKLTAIRDLHEFTQVGLGWESTDLEPFPGGQLDTTLAELEVVLPEYEEMLRPSFVVRNPHPKDPKKPWLCLVQQLASGVNLDDHSQGKNSNWSASPHAKFERLLRETENPIGLLFNGGQLRLIYAPRGETSGFITFNVDEMSQVSGRPIFAALHMLLSQDALFAGPESQRLPAILEASRRYQSTVSNELAEQVLESLFELLRGFQSADDQLGGSLLKEILTTDPDHVYAGLLTVLMRIVFLLFAEDRDLLSNDETYGKFYSITGLFKRLREDEGRYSDIMDDRFGAWSQLLTLFRMVYHGANHRQLHIPSRKGYLFDPDRFPFLEGRSSSTKPLPVPRISDGVVFRVLNKLMMLKGERLNYRTLDVEQIGSVYEAIMGFNLHVAEGPSIAIKPKKRHGAPTTINLLSLLERKPEDRSKWFSENTDQTLPKKAAQDIRRATDVAQLLSCLESRIANKVTPNMVPPGAMILQPSNERRQSGSHYTPRSLTGPIVRKALEPVLARLGNAPTPEQILNIRICDPAAGSGAFLVEACRQLGDHLVNSWRSHDCMPNIPSDEDDLLHARRIVAHRCVYGVDRNPMAVDLSKLSLWLATLAKEHPFTFLDHTVRCGDSLVGLTKRQIADYHWAGKSQKGIDQSLLEDRLKHAVSQRQDIFASDDNATYFSLEQKLGQADHSLSLLRMTADTTVSAFFQGENTKQRHQQRDRLLRIVSECLPRDSRSGNKTTERLLKVAEAGASYQTALPPVLQSELNYLILGEPPVRPFHWEIEFAEVFDRDNPGFDVIVGNPPFAGKNTLINSNRSGYLDWLKTLHENSHGNADLVAHFFRRAFSLIRHGGTLGLIATNTIRQGDTRSTGLQWIRMNGGIIYSAKRRLQWPGDAAVIVSVVHICREDVFPGVLEIDSKPVSKITAFLFHDGSDESPAALLANKELSFQGSTVLGMGFTFDDTDKKGVANSIAEMTALIDKDPRNAQKIFPYIGGEEILNSPTQLHHRYVINFGDLTEADARTSWPDLMSIVEKKVRPKRLSDNRAGYRKYWWQFAEKRVELYKRLAQNNRALALSRVGNHLAIAFLPANRVFAESTVIFPFESYAAFAVMQSRVHEIWTRFFSSSLKDDLRYAPSDCFETFPFPANFENNDALERVGRKYYERRAEVLVSCNQGLTDLYNKFHDPDETSEEVLELRNLHYEMDLQVMRSYDWADINPMVDFVLAYEDEEDDDQQAINGEPRNGRKKPWRYCWVDATHDEVFIKLLDLNKERAVEEISRQPKAKKKKDKSSTDQKKQHANDLQLLLPGVTHD